MSVIVALGILATESRSEGGDLSPAESSSYWPNISLALGAAIIAVVLGTRAMRLTSAPRNAWRLNAGGSFLLFVGLYLFGSFGGAMFQWVVGLGQDDQSLQAKVIVAAGAFLTQLVLLLVVMRGPKSISSAAPEFTPEPRVPEPLTPVLTPAWKIWQAILFGALAFVIAWFPLLAVGSIVASIQIYFGGVQPPTEGHSTLELLRNSRDMLINGAMVVIVVVCAPLVEEFTFRGAFQMGIRRAGFPRWWAIAITSALFASVHIPALTAGAMASGLATLFLLAVILGWLMERTGRIAASITAHSLFNLTNLLFFWFG